MRTYAKDAQRSATCVRPPVSLSGRDVGMNSVQNEVTICMGSEEVDERDRRSVRYPEPPEVGTGLTIQAVSQLLDVPAPDDPFLGAPVRRAPDEPKPRRPPAVLPRRPRHAAPDARRDRQGSPRGRGGRAGHPGAEVESPHEQLIDDFLQAAYRLDPRGADALLEHARETLGVETAVTGVLLPAMRQVGVWWETGRCDVAHEHLATEAARAWLNRLLYLGPDALADRDH